MNQDKQIININQKISDILAVEDMGIMNPRGTKFPKKLTLGKTYKGIFKYQEKIEKQHSTMITRIKSQIDTYNILAKVYNDMKLGSDENYNNYHQVKLMEFELNTFYRKERLDTEIRRITDAITRKTRVDYIYYN